MGICKFKKLLRIKVVFLSVLNYNSVRETGCAIDLLHQYLNNKFEFNATLSNDNKEIKECLHPMTTDGFNANM